MGDSGEPGADEGFMGRGAMEFVEVTGDTTWLSEHLILIVLSHISEPLWYMLVDRCENHTSISLNSTNS